MVKMLKKISTLFLILILGCNTPDGPDCFQKAGNLTQKTIDITGFSKIIANRNIELFIKEGIDTEIIIEAGENLINDVSARLQDDTLILTDSNTCNYVRDYDPVKVYVTTPILTEVRNSSQFTVQSQGVLTFPNLLLISEDFNSPTSYAVGDFDLELNTQNLRIVANTLSIFRLRGQVDVFKPEFYSGICRVEARDLIAQDIILFQRSSNDMLLHPVQSLRGEIVSTGDVIAVNNPPIVEVTESYTGRLIFE